MVCGIPICRSSKVSTVVPCPFGGKARFVVDDCASMRSLMERALMSPVGYQFLLHLAPRIDKVLIPPTNGRLSSVGNRQGGAGHDDGCEVGVAAHASADIDRRLRRAARDRVQLRARHSIRPGAPTCWRIPNARSNSWLRRRNTEPSCSPATPAPRHGPRLPTSTPVMSATGPVAHRARSGSFACDLSPEAGYRPQRSAVFTACSVTRQC